MEWVMRAVGAIQPTDIDGARWIGPAGGRWSRDMISLGYVRTAVGSHYAEEFMAKNGRRLTAEHLIEVNYLAHITPWLYVQPSFNGLCSRKAMHRVERYS